MGIKSGYKQRHLISPRSAHLCDPATCQRYTITTIQKMLGHKNIGTTLVYAKTLEEAKREATEKIKIL